MKPRSATSSDWKPKLKKLPPDSSCDLVLVAGGAGRRFDPQATTPKQFQLVYGKPLYQWALQTFLKWPRRGRIVVVLPHQMSEEHSEIQYVIGGSSRQISASNGLQALLKEGESTWVMVHDGARPCLTLDLLERLWEARDIHDPRWGGAVPGLPLSGSTVDRVMMDLAGTFAIQTPQLFKTSILRRAYLENEGLSAPDDATLVEKLGFKVVVVPGEYDNLKLTFREDMKRVEDWLRQRHP